MYEAFGLGVNLDNEDSVASRTRSSNIKEYKEGCVISIINI